MSRTPLLPIILAVLTFALPRPVESPACRFSRPTHTELSKVLPVAYADSLMARYPDPDSIPHRACGAATQGYILRRGFEMLADKTGEAKYFNYIKRFVDHRQ